MNFFGVTEKSTMCKRLPERESTNDELVLRALQTVRDSRIQDVRTRKDKIEPKNQF